MQMNQVAILLVVVLDNHNTLKKAAVISAHLRGGSEKAVNVYKRNCLLFEHVVVAGVVLCGPHFLSKKKKKPNFQE